MDDAVLGWGKEVVDGVEGVGVAQVDVVGYFLFLGVFACKEVVAHFCLEVAVVLQHVLGNLHSGVGRNGGNGFWHRSEGVEYPFVEASVLFPCHGVVDPESDGKGGTERGAAKEGVVGWIG